MPKCLFERATGVYLGGTMHDDLPHDVAIQVQLTLPGYPDRRTERWDGATGLRAATQSELDIFDATLARARDIKSLREAGKDIALVLTELVDWQLANTAMQAADFTPQVRQAYLDLKDIANRVKG